MLKSIIINKNNSIIKNYFNFSINGFDNKNLENKKKIKNINMTIIIQNQSLINYAIFILGASIYKS